MNTTTQSNTLPAIRALLWERWRVMRWVVPAMLLLMAPFTMLLESGWFNVAMDFGDRPVPSFMVGLLVAASMFFHGASKGYSLGLPPHLMRSPMSSGHIAYAQLFQVLISSLVLSSILAAFTMPVTLPAFVSSIGFVVSTVSLSLGVYAVVALSAPAAPVAVAAITFLTGACFVLPAWLTGTQMGAVPDDIHAALLLGWAPCVAIAAGAFPIGAMLFTHARSNHGGEPAALPFARPSILQRRGPRNHPFWARVWYEWSVWGWKFVGTAVVLIVLIGILQRVVDEHASSYAALDSSFVMLGAGAIFALVMPLTDTGKLGAGRSDLAFLAPVRLRVLLSARILTATMCVLAAALSGLMFEFAAAQVWGARFHPSELVELAVLASMSILILLAFLPIAAIALVVLGASFVVDVIFPLWLGLSTSPSVRSSYFVLEHFLWIFGILCAVVAIRCVQLLSRRGRFPAYMWILIALPGASLVALTAVLDPWFWGHMASPQDRILDIAFGFLLLAVLPVLGVAWQGVWLDRCRHGGLGWRFWRGR